MSKGLRISSIIYLLLLISCSSSIDNEKELLKWLNTPSNGFVKKSSSNGFVLTMKYLPPEYLAFNEMKKDARGNTDLQEYLESFKNSRTFLLTIAPDDKKMDATTYGVSNMSDYSQRIKDLSFNIKESLILKTDSGQRYNPVLTTMENLYEIGNKKSIYIVFSDDKKHILNSEKLDITFQDTFLDTGITHFVFKRKKIDNLPNLNFLNQ